MARYENEFMGIYGDHQPPRGMDPNYRGGGYRGMRMQEGRSQANYGYYRWRHQRDLGPEGGFYGRAPYTRPPRGEMGSGYGPRPYPYDAGMRGGGGGVRDVRYDPDFMRDFNADSPLFREGGRERPRYGRDYRERGGHPIDRDPGYRFQYGNRGMSSGGYSQPWAFGPMRGSRDR